MSASIFLLWLVSIPLLVPALEQPKGFLLSCGSKEPFDYGHFRYTPDDEFVSGGIKKTLKRPDLLPQLATLRYFPDKSFTKYCYVFPAVKGGKYLVRTTYYYGGFDGGKEPPVFDQIVDGTKWSTVNTTEDFAKGEGAYYEIVMAAMAKTLSVCLARNHLTTSDPFISAIEVRNLEDSLYNSTDFTSFVLSTVARSSFGKEEGNDKQDVIRFPDDQFNRYWHVFEDRNNPVVVSKSNITPSDYWNLPPARVFETGLTTSRGKSMEVKWPRVPLPAGNYYISLYFQDFRHPSPYSWRVFSVAINGKTFFYNLNATVSGVTVFSSKWPLSGETTIALTPQVESPVGPVINAGEILQLVPLGGRTLTRDVMVMDELIKCFDNPPPDWRGDPCLPKGTSWTGVSCSIEGKFSRVITLNLTNTGLSGSLPPSIANLTALNNLWLGWNKLSGRIPEMGTLKELRTLRLENNQFEGSVPQSLGLLPKLEEINLQGNKLDGTVPETLQKKNSAAIQGAPSTDPSASA